MKKFLVLILLLTFMPSQAKDDLNIAVVDLEAVYKRYTYLINKQEELLKAEDAVRDLFVTANNEIDQFKKTESKEASVIQKRDEIQSVIDKAVKAYQEKKAEFNKDINARIAKALESVASANAYDLILNRAFVLDHDNDVTELFLQELRKMK